MKVSLHGSYFGDNFGDVLLVKVFFDWIKEIDPNIEVNFPMINDKAYEVQPDNFGIANFLSSKVLLFCGGGYFGENKKSWKWSVRNTYRHLIIGYLAILFNKPYGIFGVEVGPLTTPWFKSLVLGLMKRSQIVCVRNQESYDFLIQNKISPEKLELVTDTILALSSDEKYLTVNKPLENKRLLLHLAFGSLHNEEILEIIQGLIILFSNNQKPDYELIFIEDYTNQYGIESKEWFKKMDDSGMLYKIEKYKDTESLIATIQNSYALITTKLHVGIIGATYSKRVLSLYSHLKVERLHKQINNSHFCLSIDKISETNLPKLLSELIIAPPINIPKPIIELSKKNKVEFQLFIRKFIR